VYFWDVPPVFHLYPACISPISRLYLTVYPCLDLYLSILQQIHCIPLYPTVSSCIRTYLAVSGCIPLYLTVSHRLKKGIWPKIHSRGKLLKDNWHSALLSSTAPTCVPLPRERTGKKARPNLKPGTVCVCGMHGLRKGMATI